MPTVSVIVPVYNVERYLPQCLDSIANQTFEDMEILCIDDGSTDSSGALLDDYAKKDNRFKVIHKANTGYGNSMNEGLRRVSGEYVSIVESDDFVEPDLLEKFIAVVRENDVDIVKSRHYGYKGGKDYLSDQIREFPKNQTINSLEYPQIVKLSHTIWSCFYKREFLMENDIWFHETPGASYQDISFAMQCWLKAESVYFIEDALLHYRNDNPDSSMHNPNKIFCVFDEYEWLESKLELFWDSHLEMEQYFIGQKYREYLNHYYRVAPQYQYALLLRAAQSLKEDIQRNRLAEIVFSQGEWDSLCRISRDVNRFFLESGKTTYDLRLDICEFQNEHSYKKGFIETLQTYPEIVIYGAGKVGQNLADWLLNAGIKIDFLAVTEKKENLLEYRGIRVVELRTFKNRAESCAVIIAVAERSQYDMYRTLMEYGFKNIFRADKLVRGFI